MKHYLALCLVAALAEGALAQPAPPAGDKGDAKALMASGLKLYSTKDYLGALAMFKEAYDRFPSSKILLNIATTLAALNRDVESANTYQRYLDAADTDPAKKPVVDKELAGLDAKLAVIEIKASLADAELQIGDEPWHPASDLSKYRVAPGKITVRVRKTRFQPWEKSLDLTAGASTSLSVDLVAVAEPAMPTTSAAPAATGVVATMAPPETPSRFGVIATAHIDIKYKGAAGVVGMTAQLMQGLQAEAAAILGPSPGGYIGARYTLLTGALHPVLAAGVPIFVSSGARFGVRGAGGVQFDLNRRFSLVAELGVEHMFNPQPNIAGTLFIPAVGALAHL